MHSFYPQAGVRFNPIFTDRQFAQFARNVEDHAAQMYQIAFAAFARAADWSHGEVLVRFNFDHLTQTGRNLLALYRIACEDPRVDQAKVGRYVNLLFWAIIGATEQLLSFEEDRDDWAKDWHWTLDRGGLFARLATDMALAGAAKRTELDKMIGCLSRLRASTARVRDYHFYLVREVPEDVDDLIGLAGDAGQLSAMLEEAEVKLRACGALEPAAG